MRTPVFELHILPMIRTIDREHMRFVFDLWDYAQVVQHADDILARTAVDMPTPESGGPWPEEWVQLFGRWIQTGFKRLELGTAQFTWTQGASSITVRATGTFPAAGYHGWLQLESETATAKTYILYFEPPDAAVPGTPETFNIRERYAVADTREVFVHDSAGVTKIH